MISQQDREFVLRAIRLHTTLSIILDKMPEQQADAVGLVAEGRDLREIAKIIGCTRERARQLADKGMEYIAGALIGPVFPKP
jgi:DNA-directed RNA polymerase specialized sigma24 family protein